MAAVISGGEYLHGLNSEPPRSGCEIRQTFGLTEVSPSIIMMLLWLVCYAIIVVVATSGDNSDIISEYKEYLATFEKPVNIDPQRLATFQANKDRICSHNIASKAYKLSLNRFADMTAAEIASHFSVHPSLSTNNHSQSSLVTSSTFMSYFLRVSRDLYLDSFPSSLNWASANNPFLATMINNVRNQGACGACWAFVTASATEAAIKLSLLREANNNHRTFNTFADVPSLSAQELIDCDTEFNYGCDGGNPRYGMQYAVRRGLVRWRSYPYREDMGDCLAPTNETRFFLTSATQLRGYDPEVIIKALQDGPIAVGICGTDDEFLFYSSGIFDEMTCCSQQNHAMLLVGYGYDERADCNYWILLNSWGEGWGERGFMRLLRTMTKSSGICGVLENPSQAVGGFIVSHGIGDWPQPSDKQAGDRMWTIAWFWFTMHWRAIALALALAMIFISFTLLGYGFYIDYLLMARARRRGYSEIEAASGIRSKQRRQRQDVEEEAAAEEKVLL